MIRRLFFIFTFLILFSDAAAAADLRGTVRLDGIPKDSYAKVPSSDWESCGMVKKSQDFVVGEFGELADVVVWVDNPSYIPPEALDRVSQVAFVDQKRCEFVPRVVLIPKGGKVMFRSSDNVRHGVAAFDPFGQGVFDRILETRSQVTEYEFPEAGPFRIRCGFHAWMKATVYVKEHPLYAVTDKNGEFWLRFLPKQDSFRIRVWHEKLGELEAITHQGQKEIEFLYQRPESLRI